MSHEFDPIAHGGIPVEEDEFDPIAHGGIPVEAAQPETLPFWQGLAHAPVQIGEDVLAGLATGGHELLRGAAAPLKYLWPSEYQRLEQAPGIREFDYSKAVGVQKPKLLDQIIQGAASFAPFALGAEAGAAAKGGGIAARLGAQALAGGAYGGAAGGPVGAALGGALGLGGEALGAGLGAISPTAYFKRAAETALETGTRLRTPTQVKDIMESVGDVPVNLFELIGDPQAARRSIRTLQGIPFSGLKKQMQTIEKATGTEANSAINQITEAGERPPSKSEDLLESLNTRHTINKRALSKEFQRLAEEADAKKVGIDFPASHASEEAKKILAEEMQELTPMASSKLKRTLVNYATGRMPKEGMEDEAALEAVTTPDEAQPYLGKPTRVPEQQLQQEATMLRQQGVPEALIEARLTTPTFRAQPVAPLAEEVPETAPLTFKTFNIAHKANSRLSSLYRDLQAQQNFTDAALIPRLQKALHEDMSIALQKGKAPHLKKEWDQARAAFKKSVVPFRQNARFANTLKGKSPPETLAKQLANNSGEMHQILDILPQKVKNEILYEHIKPGIGEEKTVNPVAISRAYQNLKPEVREKLTTESQRKSFDRLQKLLKTSEQLRLWRSPPLTGFARYIAPGLGHGIPTGLGAGAAGAGIMGHPSVAALLGLLGTGAIGAGRGAQKALTGPYLRDLYMKSLEPGRQGILEQLGAIGQRGLPSIMVPPATQNIGQQ